ncbi:MAG: class I SAM-dependent methyltransferase [Planctomycetes bacterium]|nr:class I SAM-dependent methyltransferase [Planctomycetota bacterium]
MTLSPAQRSKIEDVLRRTYYAEQPPEKTDTEAAWADFEDHVRVRYEQALLHVVPWVERTAGLAGRRVVELGSGTGSSTAAFAQHCERIHGYEICPVSTAAARGRLDALEIRNAEVTVVDPSTMLDTIGSNHPDGADAVLLYAVLEHMTFNERLVVLEAAWKFLEPGGIIVVVETPNRLAYFDSHTSQLPFFGMLPPEIAVRYVDRSPRRQLVDELRAADDKVLKLSRWGLGLSYHEFELAFDRPLRDVVVADGYEEEIVAIYPVEKDEELLREYFAECGVDVPVGFARSPLNFVVRK